jgi:hypothetical protein
MSSYLFYVVSAELVFSVRLYMRKVMENPRRCKCDECKSPDVILQELDRIALVRVRREAPQQQQVTVAEPS